MFRLTCSAAILLCSGGCSPAPVHNPDLLAGTPDASALSQCEIVEGKILMDYAPSVTPTLRNVSCRQPQPSDTMLTCTFEARAQGFGGLVPGTQWITGKGYFRHPNTGHAEADMKRWCATGWSGNLDDSKTTGFQIY